MEKPVSLIDALTSLRGKNVSIIVSTGWGSIEGTLTTVGSDVIVVSNPTLGPVHVALAHIVTFKEPKDG